VFNSGQTRVVYLAFDLGTLFAIACPGHLQMLENSMNFLQDRLAAVDDMQHAAIASTAHLKSQLSELEGLRERVREALEIASSETVECYGATQVLSWKVAMNLRPAIFEGGKNADRS
jgi:hypothetical protein